MFETVLTYHATSLKKCSFSKDAPIRFLTFQSSVKFSLFKWLYFILKKISPVFYTRWTHIIIKPLVQALLRKSI